MHRKRKKYLVIILLFFLVFYLLPNLVNFRERSHFSDSRRLQAAKQAVTQGYITVIPGGYYSRGKVYKWFFGEKNRDLWNTAVTVPVFSYREVKGGLKPYDIGGSQQTVSIRLVDSLGRHWVLRSVNKDQQNVLPWWLRRSILRPVFRDQVSSMNPYGARVVAALSDRLALPHLNPEIYWVPFEPRFGKYNERMAGRLVYLEEYLDSTWQNEPRYGSPHKVLDHEDLEEIKPGEGITFDTLLYLKTRLFDMLINDWDRHKGQWRFALVTENERKILKPVAKDRDMAFYVFDEGVVNNIALRSNEKFQSYRGKFGRISGLVKQSREMDKRFLKNIPLEIFLRTADEIRSQLSPQSISAAFRQYPPVIYQRYGRPHEAILQSRLTQLRYVAAEFHDIISGNQAEAPTKSSME
ncbi:MAG TPA: hypothetical protein VF145_00690 [Chitinophagaceae bacterium]